MDKIYFEQYEDEVKCSGCGWETTILYVTAKNQKEADKLLKEGVGLCSQCFLEYLIDNNVGIVFDEDSV